MGDRDEAVRTDASFSNHAGRVTRRAPILAAAPLQAFPGPFGDGGLRPALSLVASVLDMDLVLLGHVNSSTYTAVASYSQTGRVTFPKGSTIPIEETYCREEITAQAPFAIGDAASDPSYCEHPGYTLLGLRAYAGVPIVLEDGTLFGTLCATDTEPRAIHPEMVERLLLLSGVVSSELSRRLGLKRMTEVERSLERANRHLNQYIESLARTAVQRAEQVRTLAGSLEEARRARFDTVRRLRRLHETLGEFTYSVAHDLSEPLRRLDTLTEAVLKDPHLDADAAERQFLEQMRVEAGSARSRILALREFSEILRADFPVAAVSLTDVALEVVKNLGPRIRAAGATVTVAPDLPEVPGQRVRLYQLLRHLVENSLQHAQGPELRVEIRHGELAGVLEVRDNGPGIPALYREQVFRIFNRGPLTFSDSSGYGVGLTLVQHVAELHGGHVWIEEAPGGGTSVQLTLPGIQQPESPPPAAV